MILMNDRLKKLKKNILESVPTVDVYKRQVFMLYALNEKMGLELCRSITACAEKWRNA